MVRLLVKVLGKVQRHAIQPPTSALRSHLALLTARNSCNLDLVIAFHYSIAAACSGVNAGDDNPVQRA